MQALIQETVHENSDIDVLVVTEPFFDIPFMRNRLKDAIIEMAWQVRQDIPADVDDEDIAVVLASHGTPYNPPFPEFGWQEGEIFSNLILTEDLFHEELSFVALLTSSAVP